MLVAIGTLFIGISIASAQEQERRLMDRLLKPNTSQANSAQNKKFADKRAASFDKLARTGSFYSPQKPVAKTFPEERTFTPREFTARHFRAGDSAGSGGSSQFSGRSGAPAGGWERFLQHRIV